MQPVYMNKYKMIYISAVVAQWPEMLSTSPKNMSSIPDAYRMISSSPRIKITTSSDVGVNGGGKT